MRGRVTCPSEIQTKSVEKLYNVMEYIFRQPHLALVSLVLSTGCGSRSRLGTFFFELCGESLQLGSELLAQFFLLLELQQNLVLLFH